MGKEIVVQVSQISSTTSEGSVRGHTVLVDRPESKDGTDRGAMGGELLLLSLGGCFMSNLLAAVRARDAAVSNIVINVTGTLEGSPPHYTRVDMTVMADHDDRSLMEKLILISERSCIVSNTLKQGLDLSVRLAASEAAP